RDSDIMVTHAQVLAWAGKTAASEALYDSVLVRFPDRADALAGRARATAWSGDLDRAEDLWRKALERHPDDPELLVGLAQTLYWKGQPDLAEVYATRARAVAPEDRAARDLARAVRAALRPEIATNVDGASDSDHNDFVAQEATVTASLGSDLRGRLRAGWRHATDQAGDGSSYWPGGNVIAALGHGAALRAGLGVRRIPPAVVAARSPFTAELGARLRPAPGPAPDGMACRTLAVTRLGCEQRNRPGRLDHQQRSGHKRGPRDERRLPLSHAGAALPAGALGLRGGLQPPGRAQPERAQQP